MWQGAVKETTPVGTQETSFYIYFLKSEIENVNRNVKKNKQKNSKSLSRYASHVQSVRHRHCEHSKNILPLVVFQVTKMR